MDSSTSRRTRRRWPWALFLALTAASCGLVGGGEEEPDPDQIIPPMRNPAPVGQRVGRFARWIEGHFAGRVEATAEDWDLAVARIWIERRDGLWLFLEAARQPAARGAAPDVYEVWWVRRRPDDSLEVLRHDVPGGIEFVGAAHDPEALDVLGPKDLLLREACDLVLLDDGESFQGGTSGDGCASDAPGAVRSNLRVVVTAARLLVWKRDWDEDGRQVGGPTAPVSFEKRR